MRMPRCGEPSRRDGRSEFAATRSRNVPEPEIGVVLGTNGRIAGYTIGNDVSSRDIEGANPLYLPQAKSTPARARSGRLSSCLTGPSRTST